MNNCGISRWDDPNEINARLKALTSQPIWEVTDDYYNNVILKYFDEKCKASKAVYEESKEYIPGGVQHNLAFNKPFPMCMARADGAYLYDNDGNQYIDFLQAGGPTILGSNYPVIREKVIELLNECGPVTGLLHESELMIAKEINRHMPNVEMFRMLGSGTESVMAALRIARIATGKKRIIKVGGAYHGWSDQMVYGLKIPGSRALLESHGIPGGCYEATDEVRPNDLTMLEDMLKRNVLLGGTAGVIVEPVGPESGTRPVAHDYNAGVRALCDKYGALMIFDEPEAALSPSRQMYMLCRIKQLVESGSQFIVSTHSPIVMAYPGADIYEIADNGLQLTELEQTPHYLLMKRFCLDHEGMLRQLGFGIPES